MKSPARILFVALLLVAASLGFYVLRERSQFAAQRQALDAKIAEAHAAADRALHERETAERELAALARAAQEAASKVAASQAAASPPTSAIAEWEKKVAMLHSLLAQHREWAIPEIELLSPDEFIYFARDAQLDNEEAQRKALRDLRALAKRKVVPVIREALDEYIVAHDGRLPTALGELTPLFKTPLSEAVLKRYALTGLAEIPSGQRETSVLYERTAVDELYDTRHVLGLRMSTQFLTNPEVYVFTRAIAAYGDANAGRKPTQAAELGPYLEVPLDAPVLTRYFNGWQKDPATLEDPAAPTMRRTGSVTVFRPLGSPREPAK